MANRVHSDNKSGDSTITNRTLTASEAAESQGANMLDSNSDNITALDDWQKSEYDQLIGSPKNTNSINWFGSSYSGVDIKVIAHLYGDGINNGEAEKERLEEQKEISTEIMNGCFNLQHGGLDRFISALVSTFGLTYDDTRQLFLDSAGLKNQGNIAQQLAGTFLIDAILQGRDFFTFTGATRAKNIIQSVYEGQSDLVESLASRISDLDKIDKEAHQTIVLATLQTLSIQSHREKVGVRALGHSYVKGYSRGPRTIAGSMIFTVFNEHALMQLIRSMGSSKTYGELDADLSLLIPDQLPPIDLTIVCANEYGSISTARILGVEFVNDGMTLSIEDLLTENVLNFVARDNGPLTSHGNIALDRLQAAGAEQQDLTGTELIFGNKRYDDYVHKLGVQRRLKSR